MKFTVYNPVTGRISHSGSCAAEDFELQARDGMALIEGEFGDDKFYWDGDAMAEFPPRPEQHDWDWSTKAWVPNVERAKAAKHREIERARDARIEAAVIEYDGKLLDARPRDKGNLADKLTEVRSRIDRNEPLPPEQLVWRDHEDQMHYFPDMVAYKHWLDGFAIAMGTRGTAAYAWSWEKKAQLEAASDLQQIAAIDLS